MKIAQLIRTSLYGALAKSYDYATSRLMCFASLQIDLIYKSPGLKLKKTRKILYRDLSAYLDFLRRTMSPVIQLNSEKKYAID